MRRFIVSAVLGVSALAAACGPQTIKLPEGRPGSTNVSGALRARSTHYQLIGTLSPGGGAHASSSHELHNGVFTNQKQ